MLLSETLGWPRRAHLYASCYPLTHIPSISLLHLLVLISLQRLRQYQASEAKQARTQQLKELDFFKQADEGSEALNASVLMFVASGPQMWAACNNIFSERMQEATEMWDKALQRKLTWMYLMAPIYAHQDRQLYFDTTTELVFGSRLVQMNMLLKIYANNGTTDLHLVTAKNVRLGPDTHALLFKTESK